MLKFVKDSGFKVVDESSSIIPILSENGWIIEGDEQALDLDDLRAKAEELGLKPHHKAGPNKIADMIKEAKEKWVQR